MVALTSPRRKEMFYLTMHSTHYIYGYMASDTMVKDHSDSEIVLKEYLERDVVSW